MRAVGQRFVSVAGDRAHVRRRWHAVVLCVGDTMRSSSAGKNMSKNWDSDMCSWWCSSSRLAKVWMSIVETAEGSWSRPNRNRTGGGYAKKPKAANGYTPHQNQASTSRSQRVLFQSSHCSGERLAGIDCGTESASKCQQSTRHPPELQLHTALTSVDTHFSCNTKSYSNIRILTES